MATSSATHRTDALSPGRGWPFWALALVCVLAIEAGGFVIGGMFGPQPGGWYFQLEKPWFNPPVWVFPVAWTLLYAMMGVALALLLRAAESPAKTRALWAFWIQLAFNYAWSVVFFGLQALGPATYAAAALCAAVAVATATLVPVDRRAAALMVPYLLWTAFALVLAGAIWRLNG